MLSRQKVILSLLSRSNGPLTKLSFVKLMFLLRNEYRAISDSPFYDFVPYKYGPFSFALYREMDALAQQGYIALSDEGVALAPDFESVAHPPVKELPEAVLAAVSSVCQRFAHWDDRTLVADVYRRYPWYASKSELRELCQGLPVQRPVAEVAVYTAGYGEKSVDAFFDNLLRTGIRAIVDVRANPVSRKYGFARKSMSSIASKLDIDYTHEPEVGIPSALRKHIDSVADLDRLLDTYEQEILPRNEQAVARVCELIQRKPSVMVCAEKDARHCHRERLASAVSKMIGLQVIHL
jgi:uncharacterized protein (DUF488 family)